MYLYDAIDQSLVDQRVEQFRGQVRRRMAGALSEDEFKPLRLMNGLYLQLHAYMLRVAVPYGTLSSQQMRRLARISRDYDRGYGHFTTRQNIQFNWPRLEDMPAILADLAEVEMHAVQTSGNCIRNVTADQYAGVTADEVADPNDLWVKFWNNGDLRHDYNTSDMEHRVPELVEFATSIMTLSSGDVISCGTNHEGLGPMQDGELAEIEIQGIGRMAVHVSDPLKRTWERGIYMGADSTAHPAQP